MLRSVWRLDNPSSAATPRSMLASRVHDALRSGQLQSHLHVSVLCISYGLVCGASLPDVCVLENENGRLLWEPVSIWGFAEAHDPTGMGFPQPPAKKSSVRGEKRSLEALRDSTRPALACSGGLEEVLSWDLAPC